VKAPTAPALSSVEPASRSAGKVETCCFEQEPSAQAGGFLFRTAILPALRSAKPIRWRICGNQRILSGR